MLLRQRCRVGIEVIVDVDEKVLKIEMRIEFVSGELPLPRITSAVFFWWRSF
jgi:hypothetical protein